MRRYRFVGCSEAGILNSFKGGMPVVYFRQYGQLFELSDNDAIAQARGRLLFIPDSLFGHGEEERKKFARFASHRTAPETFLKQRQLHWDMADYFHQHPEEVLNPPSFQLEASTNGV